MQSNIRLATRKSRLALHQSMLVRDALISADSGLQVELIEVSTTGDRQQDWSLQNEGGVCCSVVKGGKIKLGDKVYLEP